MINSDISIRTKIDSSLGIIVSFFGIIFGIYISFISRNGSFGGNNNKKIKKKRPLMGICFQTIFIFSMISYITCMVLFLINFFYVLLNSINKLTSIILSLCFVLYIIGYILTLTVLWFRLYFIFNYHYTRYALSKTKLSLLFIGIIIMVIFGITALIMRFIDDLSKSMIISLVFSISVIICFVLYFVLSYTMVFIFLKRLLYLTKVIRPSVHQFNQFNTDNDNVDTSKNPSVNTDSNNSENNNNNNTNDNDTNNDNNDNNTDNNSDNQNDKIITTKQSIGSSAISVGSRQLVMIKRITKICVSFILLLTSSLIIITSFSIGEFTTYSHMLFLYVLDYTISILCLYLQYGFARYFLYNKYVYHY